VADRAVLAGCIEDPRGAEPDRFEYGFLPPALFRQVLERFPIRPISTRSSFSSPSSRRCCATTSHTLLLRASGLTQNKDYNPNAVTGTAQGDAGVPHGRLLVEFAEAVLGEDDAALSYARAELMMALDPAGLVDAAGVVGLFNAIDRVADATGIPLETEKAEASADFRASLGLDRFSVAARS